MKIIKNKFNTNDRSIIVLEIDNIPDDQAKELVSLMGDRETYFTWCKTNCEWCQANCIKIR